MVNVGKYAIMDPAGNVYFNCPMEYLRLHKFHDEVKHFFVDTAGPGKSLATNLFKCSLSFSCPLEIVFWGGTPPASKKIYLHEKLKTQWHEGKLYRNILDGWQEILSLKLRANALKIGLSPQTMHFQGLDDMLVSGNVQYPPKWIFGSYTKDPFFFFLSNHWITFNGEVFHPPPKNTLHETNIDSTWKKIDSWKFGDSELGNHHF